MGSDTSERRYVIPPAVQADRMQRYAVSLLVGSFAFMGLNYESLTLEKVVWFASGILATFSLLCAIAVVILHAIAWNFDRLRDEWAGQRTSQEVGTPDPEAPPRSSSHTLADG